MNPTTKILHVGIQYDDRKSAETFFTKILGLKLKKSFTLSKELTKNIFGIFEDILIDVYENEESCFEVFITDKITKYRYEHICIEIENIDDFISNCKKYGIDPIFVKKGLKTLLFIKDFSGNLYEIKEKK